MKRFEDKSVLVTGAASGIGLATAMRLAQEGASVVLADINAEGAQQAAAHIAATHGVKAIGIAFDAASVEACAALPGAARAALGGLDVVVNSAGILDWVRTHEADPAKFDLVLKINLYAVFHVSRAALPYLLEVGGNIVNISSSAALAGVPYAAAYCASKAGVLGMTRAMAMEYADQGVRVNAICPGTVETPLLRKTAVPAWADMKKVMSLATKTGKPSAPEEIGAAVAYLASADACNVTGIALSVDGGQTAG